MEVMNLSKPFSVNVYSDFRRSKPGPWVRIGEFDKLDDAIEACKKVVDDFLQSPINAFIGSERLETAFLNNRSNKVSMLSRRASLGRGVCKELRIKTGPVR